MTDHPTPPAPRPVAMSSTPVWMGALRTGKNPAPAEPAAPIRRFPGPPDRIGGAWATQTSKEIQL
ncbi:hypothetical protein ACH4PU_31010 [Streptomyces sp. NPDC021100]|uniref:hypothetical protein n=1 Tax=Streptomyces sp. NPDC021100 TaxID=3365114 RepID=UPI003798C5F5